MAAPLLALVLVACQQGNSKPATEAAVPATKLGAKDYEPTEVFRERQNELGYKMAEHLLRGCADAIESEDTMKACYRDRTLTAFDTSGLADRHCPVRADDFKGELVCIVTGSLGYQLAQNIGQDAAAKFDWNNPQESLNAISIDFILGEIQKCLGGSSASSPDDCVTDAVVKRLDIPDSDVKLCLGLTDDFKQGQCLGEALAVKYISAGIDRL